MRNEKHVFIFSECHKNFVKYLVSNLGKDGIEEVKDCYARFKNIIFHCVLPNDNVGQYQGVDVHNIIVICNLTVKQHDIKDMLEDRKVRLHHIK